MGFDASKASDAARVLDLDASPYCQIPDATASAVDWSAIRARRVDPRAAWRAYGVMAGMLASNIPPTKLDSAFLRGSAGISALNTLETFRPGGACARGISAFADNSILRTVAKVGSLAESQASVARNAPMVGDVANDLRKFDLVGKQATAWRSVYPATLENWATQQVAAIGRTFAAQSAGGALGFAQSLDIRFAGIGAQVAQNYFKSPLFAEIGRLAGGFAGLAQQVGKLIEGWRPRIDGAFEWLRREMERWPRDPYGELVPFWNLRLYTLAQAAYEGDYVARARFLDEIGTDGSPDNVLIIEALLKPTFDPERVDRRVDWEQMDPAGARRWLKQRLNGLKLGAWKEEQERKNGERRYEVERQVTKASSADIPELELVEFELREDERALYEQLRGVLPEQQYRFCWYRAQGLTYDEIAARMGIAPGTVKAHAYLLRQNPGFLAVLGR